MEEVKTIFDYEHTLMECANCLDEITQNEEKVEAFARRNYIRYGGLYVDKLDFYCRADEEMDCLVVKAYLDRQFVAMVQVTDFTPCSTACWVVAEGIGNEADVIAYCSPKVAVETIDTFVAEELLRREACNEARTDI